MSDEEEGGRGSLSLTEMLLKELEAEVRKPNQQAEADGSTHGREAHTPPPLIRNWQSVLLKPDDESHLLSSVKTHSFREVLEGVVHEEDQRESMSSMMDSQFSQTLNKGTRPSVPTTTAVTTMHSVQTDLRMTRPPPSVHTFVRGMAPMMSGPPPAVPPMNGPPPAVPSMSGPPPAVPPMNGPPPAVPSMSGPPPAVPSMSGPPPAVPSMSGPPPAVPPMSGPPPSLPLMNGPPPAVSLMSGPPPPLMPGPPPARMMTGTHGAMMNLGYHAPGPMMNMMHTPPPPTNAVNNSYMPYYTGPGVSPHHNLNGHMNHSNDLLKYQPLPISVASIPDTTLASQLKGKKKKRQRRQESRFDKPASPPVASAAQSPSLLPSTAPPLSSTLRDDLPPLPDNPPLPPNPAPSSPAKSSSLKHVKEHKIVMKVQSRTLNESTLKIKPFEIRKKSIVADYCTDSDGEPEKRKLPDSEKKKSLHDPITSLRLGDNEALPDLYSKLRKLNKELAMLKPHSSSDSSSSSCDEEERSTDRDNYSKPVKITELNNDSMDDEPERGVDNTDSLTSGSSSHVIPGLSTVRSKLDTRIKMMLDKKPTPVKRSAAPIIPRLPPLPKPPPPPEKVPFRKRQQPPAPSPVAVVVDDTLRPLARTPSPFLSKEIYHYWHKESLKFRKYCAKTQVHHVDPKSRHKFHKSRVLSTQNKPLRSESANGIDSLLEKNVKKNSAKDKISLSDDLALTDLESDFKKLEEINRQLQELDEEEECHPESRHSDSDDEVNSADLRRLEELKRELQKLEEEDCEGDNDPVVNGDCHQTEAVVEEEMDEMSEPVSNSNEAAPDIVTPVQSLVTPNIGGCGEDASRVAKRKADADLISLVMSTVMEELKKDLRASITNNLVNEQIAECGGLPCKKVKMEV